MNTSILNKYIDLMIKFFDKKDVEEIINKWNESHRYYHNINHLSSMLKQIDDYFLTDENESLYMTDIYNIFVISAFLHDVIYDPKSNVNEDRSIEYFKKISTDKVDKYSDDIIQFIECTKHREIPSVLINNGYVKRFWLMDNNILIDGTISDLIEYENQIFKEFQFTGYDIYKIKRIQFLKESMNIFNIKEVSNNLNILIEYIKNRKIRVGVYSGSFNPFHIGHLDILRKSESLFDKVIIAYGNNPEKSERVIEVPSVLNYNQVDTYTGLVTDYINSLEEKGFDVTLIRGLRNGADLDYESNQLSFIHDIKPDVKVVYIPCDKRYEHISSSAIRSLMKFNVELTSKYIVK